MAKYLRTPEEPGIAVWVDGEDAIPNADIDYGGYMVVGQTQTYPLDATKHERNARGTHAQQIYDAYDTHYSRCFAEVSIITAAGAVTKTRDLNFANNAAILAYANSNLANSGGLFTETMRIRFYDKVDPSIKPIRKIMGFNATLGRIRSQNGWNTHIGTNSAHQFLIDMWNNTLGGFPAAKGTADWNTDGDAWHTFWLPGAGGRSYSLAYKFPWNKPNILWDFNQMVSGGVIQNRAGNFAVDVTNIWWGGVMPDGTTLVNDYGGANLRLQTYYQMQGYSLVLGVALTNGAGGNAMAIVPCGMDTFNFSWFDTASYRLEAVGQAAPNKAAALRACTPTLAGWAQGDMIGHVGFGQFGEVCQAPSRRRRSRQADFVPPGSTRFQLRDLTTNEVSPLSQHEIYFEKRQRFIQSPAFVRLAQQS